MRNKKLKSIALIPVLIFLSFSVYAQQTSIYDDPDASFRMANELIEKKQFGAAQEKFRELLEILPEANSVMRLEAQYYDALCDFKLDHPQAAEKFKQFIRNYPDHSLTNVAWLNLGLISYGNRKYRQAVEAFEQVDPYLLSPEQLNEYLYKLGYCYLKKNMPDKARQVLIPVINTPSQYQNAANYYFAYIAYSEGDYTTALKHFERVENDKTFGDKVQVYLLQIYYINRDYDEIISIGPDIVDRKTENKKQKAEAAAIVGEAFYEKNEFALALPYLQMYERISQKPLTREQNYQLGYSYYSTGDYEEAVKYFERTVKQKDLISQNAWYHLADCYLKTGQKQFAQNAFYAACQMDFDEKIREDALFNYAKLTFELSYDPFNQAMEVLKQYIADYPGSDRIDEAYAYLINLLYSTKDYQASIDAIEGIRIKNKDLRKAYQKITFMRGVQLFDAGKYTEAMMNFRKSLANNYNAVLTAKAKFWMGETHFRLGEYNKAIDYYDNFMTSPGAYNLDIYPMTKYNMGYAYFKLKYYDNAVIEFEEFINRPVAGKDEFKTDAMLRMGDCYFITKNFEDAVVYYEKAVSRRSPDSDYALYQTALSQGALGKNNEKIALLKKLVNRYPESAYADDAYFEIASTYLLMNDNRNALTWFDRLTQKFRNSSYLVKSLQKSGLIHYNENDYNSALTALKKVVKNYPGSDEARESLVTIRNIYMDQNRVEAYYEYVKGVPFANVTATEQDSITYLAAENFYMNGQCRQAAGAFGDYLAKYPDGAFVLNAGYYKAECDLKNGDTLQALEGYRFVLAKPKSRFTENALKRAATLNFALANYQKAGEQYNRLELIADYPENLIVANEGQMECNYYLGDYQKAMSAARKLLKRDKITNEQMLDAHYILARSAMAIDSIDLAKKEFNRTVELSDGEKGAEAKYMLAAIRFTMKDYKGVENMIFELANEFPAYEYWKAKGFIMLADIYAVNGNTFQAKQTLQSIIDNYPGNDLKEIAGQKLETIIKKEQAQAGKTKDTINEQHQK